MSVDYRAYLLYGHKLDDAKIDEKIEMILDGEVDAIGGVDASDIEDYFYCFNDESFFATVITKADYYDEFKELKNIDALIAEAEKKMDSLYLSIGGFDYLEKDIDKPILLLDCDY